MKKLLIIPTFVIALLSLSLLANGAKSISFETKEVFQKTPKYTLDLGSLEKLSDSQIESTVEKFVNSIPNEELTCTLTITGTITIKVVEFQISLTITGPCSEVRAKGKELAQQVMQEVKNYLKAHF